MAKGIERNWRMRKLEGVKAGEVIRVKQVDGRYGEVLIKASCGDKHGGHWFCVTHQEHFQNQFMKDVHIAPSLSGRPKTNEHRLVWICHEHGAEEP